MLAPPGARGGHPVQSFAAGPAGERDLSFLNPLPARMESHVQNWGAVSTSSRLNLTQTETQWQYQHPCGQRGPVQLLQETFDVINTTAEEGAELKFWHSCHWNQPARGLVLLHI